MQTPCELEFEDNPSKVVYSGQTINGHLKLHLTKEKKVRGVYILFYGKGEIRLAPGLYSHSFSYTVPLTIPSTMFGKYSYVRYKVCVVFDLAWQSDEKFEYPFTVIQPINLNHFHNLKSPVIAEKDHRFFAFISTDPLFLRAQIPVGGFIPGQTIDLKFDAINKSNIHVSKFKIKFVKQITCTTKDKVCRPAPKLETITICHEMRPGCDMNNEKNYQVNFSVPPIVPTNTSSRIIKVEYFIRIVGCIGGFHKNVTFDVPIIIGSCPFSDN